MPAPTPTELRERVVGALENGEGTYKEIAERFQVGEASVSRWARLVRETGSVAPRAHAGSRRDKVIAGPVLEFVLALVNDEAVWSTSQIAAEIEETYGIVVDRRTVGRALRDAGHTYKRGSSGRQLPSGTRQWQLERRSLTDREHSTPPNSSSSTNPG
jgi:transposase